MLTVDVERYLSLRQTLGYKLRDVSRNLRSFARFAVERGEEHILISTAIIWSTESLSMSNRHVRLRDVAQLARFLHAEDPTHEILPNPFPAFRSRRLPYIYAPQEIVQLLEAVGGLRASYPLRRRVYATMIGLIAATGLRVSEALDLRIKDILPGGVLHIRRTKFGKSRMLPLHPTVVDAVAHYLEERCRLAVADDHLFLSASHRRISSSTVEYTFGRMRELAGIVLVRSRPPRIHDLRHTFATRALEQCSTRRDAVARHFVALSTYMGHSDIAHTYWYLEATPDLMTDIAKAAELLVAGESL
jgi:integrase